MLVEHDAVETDLFRELVFDHPLFVKAAAGDWVEEFVGEQECGVAKLASFVLGISGHRLFSEIHQMHTDSLRILNSLKIF